VVFCFPSNPLIDSVAEVGIRPIVGREERTVINMADGFTRAHNGHRIGVCMVQGGPGAEHAFGGVAQAFADSVPILLLPAGAPRARLGLRTTFDAVEAYRPIAKWAARFETAESVPDQLRRAFSKMRSGRPGPVVLEMPADVTHEQFDDVRFSYEPPARPRSAADPEAITTAVRLLLAAERPIIHVGQGVLWAEATEELVAFAELVDVPVMTTYIGKSAFPEDHPLSIGAGGAAVSPGVYSLLPQADLVFSVGSSLARSLGSCPIPRGKTMVQCTNDPDDLSMEYPIAVGLVGDAKLLLAQLREEVLGQLSGKRRMRGTSDQVAEVRLKAITEWEPKFSSDDVPINPLRVVAAIIAAIDANETIITHDSGYPRDHLAPFYISTRPRSYLGWGNSTPLGSSIGLALGAKCAAPEKMVINLMGDAAFGQSGLDIETGVRNNIPILCIILNNSEMGNYEKMQPVAQESFGIKGLSGHYAEIGAALGAWARRVELPDEVAPALEEALAEVRGGTCAVLEIVTRPEPASLRL